MAIDSIDPLLSLSEPEPINGRCRCAMHMPGNPRHRRINLLTDSMASFSLASCNLTATRIVPRHVSLACLRARALGILVRALCSGNYAPRDQATLWVWNR